MKKRYRYRVVVKGTTISRHFTKLNASKAAGRIRGARVVPLYSSSRRKRRRSRY